MSFALFVRTAALESCVVLTGCGFSPKNLPPERLYQSGEFCLDEKRWGEVIAYSKGFGLTHNLELAGRANEYEGAGLNLTLSRRSNPFREKAISLWILSNPFDRQKAGLSAITREKMTPADLAVAKAYEAGLMRISC